MPNDAPKELTAKQKQVVDLFGKGLGVNAIASRMKIQPQGVYGHVRRIREAGLGHLLDPTPEIPASAPAPASSDGSQANGTITMIDKSVSEAIELADDRLGEIDEERARIKGEREALDARLTELGDEQGALSARRKHLQAVGK